MIAVLTGDIVDSTHHDKARWLPALKSALGNWGQEGSDWEVYRGDEFQLRLNTPATAILTAFRIKAHVKARADTDIRIAIGLDPERPGSARREKQQSSHTSPEKTGQPPPSLTESSGPAFIHSGRKLDEIKKQRIHLAIASDNAPRDREWNLLLQWALLSADNWSSVSAEIVDLALTHPELSQTDMATRLNVQQPAISHSGKHRRFNTKEPV